LLSEVASLLWELDDSNIGNGAEPSPTRATGWSEFTEVAPLTALRAPANIKAARAAIAVFFTVTNLQGSNL
jgi:hypothetical protein